MSRESDFLRPCKNPGTARKSPRVIRGLANARALALEYPDTFEVPSDAYLKKLKPGDLIKVARNNERFWVRLDGYVGRKYHGTVANDLIFNEDLKFGDSIYFMRKNIYDFRYKCPE